jgi:hypothetical protein
MQALSNSLFNIQNINLSNIDNNKIKQCGVPVDTLTTYITQLKNKSATATNPNFDANLDFLLQPDVITNLTNISSELLKITSDTLICITPPDQNTCMIDIPLTEQQIDKLIKVIDTYSPILKNHYNQLFNIAINLQQACNTNYKFPINKKLIKMKQLISKILSIGQEQPSFIDQIGSEPISVIYRYDTWMALCISTCCILCIVCIVMMFSGDEKN